jgi:hypothetical protein
VFFVEVKTALAIENLSARADTDDQMRLRLRQLFGQSLTKLHGISALGTRLCFYYPSLIPRNAAYINDTAPADRWYADILADDGYNRFMNIVEHVRALATAECVWPFLLVLLIRLMLAPVKEGEDNLALDWTVD